MTSQLPFSFPYYGQNQTTAYVGSNGYITFGTPDSQYTESLPSFQQYPRISAFFDDLDERCAPSGVFINDTLPGRFVVTYDRVQHYSCNGRTQHHADSVVPGWQDRDGVQGDHFADLRARLPA